jgi:hypothetical protein
MRNPLLALGYEDLDRFLVLLTYKHALVYFCISFSHTLSMKHMTWVVTGLFMDKKGFTGGLKNVAVLFFCDTVSIFIP